MRKITILFYLFSVIRIVGRLGITLVLLHLLYAISPVHTLIIIGLLAASAVAAYSKELVQNDAYNELLKMIESDKGNINE